MQPVEITSFVLQDGLKLCLFCGWFRHFFVFLQLGDLALQIPGYLQTPVSPGQILGGGGQEDRPPHLGGQSRVGPALVDVHQGQLSGLQQPDPATVRLVQHPFQRAVLGQSLHDAHNHHHLLLCSHGHRHPPLHQVSSLPLYLIETTQNFRDFKRRTFEFEEEVFYFFISD